MAQTVIQGSLREDESLQGSMWQSTSCKLPPPQLVFFLLSKASLLAFYPQALKFHEAIKR